MTPASSKRPPAAPPTAAPIFTPLLLLLSVLLGVVTVGAAALADRVSAGEVFGPALLEGVTELRVVVVEDEDETTFEVVLASPVKGPGVAAASWNTAVDVLQQRCFSASDSQQYFALSPYPWVPHSHICTPPDRKSYAEALFGVSWFNWHCWGHNELSQLLSVHVPRA